MPGPQYYQYFQRRVGFLLGYSFIRVFLTIVGKASNIGTGDLTYEGILVLLFSSPALWGRRFITFRPSSAPCQSTPP